MPARPTSLRGQVFRLVLALAIPAIVLEGWWSFREYQDANARAQLEALAIAERTSVSVHQFLVTTGELMTGVSRELHDQFGATESCESLVRTLTDVLPYFVNTLVRGPDGTLLCAAEPPSSVLAAADIEFGNRSDGGRFPAVSDPVHDMPSGNLVLPVGVPVRTGDDGEIGTLIGFVPLTEFETLLPGIAVDDTHLVTIATSDLQVITRSRDAAAWVGQTLPSPENEDDTVGPGRYVATGPDATDTERAWGVAAVAGTDWEVFVGIPEREVNAPALAMALRRVGLTALFLSAGILLAMLSYHRIDRALRGLVAGVRDVGRGERVRLPEGTPREVSAVVEQFNRTLDQRDAAEAAEHRALERYASIFNEAVFGIFVATAGGKILEANPALATMLGHGEIRPVLDAPLRSWFRDPDQHDIMLATCLAEGTIEGFVTEWLRTDGERIVVRIDGKTVRTDDGAEGVEMIVDDVTEELQRDRELQQTQKMEAIGRLAGGIAHDFNNLLTVISANSELMDENLPEGSPIRPDLNQIRTAASRASALTRQLLSFSRSDPSETRNVDVNSVVSELDAMLHRLIGADIRLETDLDPDVPPVHADSSRLEQVVMNLVLNARDALPHGGSIRIATDTVTGTEPNGTGGRPEVLLTVRDDGTGMDAATRARIFEPFFTTKEEGKGTGLGLATVYGIVRQTGGRVEVESEVNEGTTFRIWLPGQAGS